MSNQHVLSVGESECELLTLVFFIVSHKNVPGSMLDKHGPISPHHAPCCWLMPSTVGALVVLSIRGCLAGPGARGSVGPFPGAGGPSDPGHLGSVCSGTAGVAAAGRSCSLVTTAPCDDELSLSLTGSVDPAF